MSCGFYGKEKRNNLEMAMGEASQGSDVLGEQSGVSHHRDGGDTQRRGWRCGICQSQQRRGCELEEATAHLGNMERRTGTRVQAVAGRLGIFLGPSGQACESCTEACDPERTVGYGSGPVLPSTACSCGALGDSSL